MAKTLFVDGNPGAGIEGTIVTAAFLNSIYRIGGGHVHDGLEMDGHAAKIYAEFEIGMLSFQLITWAQFCIYDAFDNETKREDPDPSGYSAILSGGTLIGADATPGRIFGFVSKTYNNMTTIDSGTSTSVGLNFLTDTSKSLFTDEYKNTILVDSLGATFVITNNTSDTFTVSGTPAAGAYTIKDDDPAYFVAFCVYQDSQKGGGYGYLKLEVSFNGGSNYQTVLDSKNNIDILDGTVSMAHPGTSYKVRLFLENDDQGRSPVVNNFLIATDPSPWRW